MNLHVAQYLEAKGDEMTMVEVVSQGVGVPGHDLSSGPSVDVVELKLHRVRRDLTQSQYQCKGEGCQKGQAQALTGEREHSGHEDGDAVDPQKARDDCPGPSTHFFAPESPQ